MAAIVSYPNNLKTIACRIVAEYNPAVNLTEKDLNAPESLEALKASLSGSVPVLKLSDGSCLSEAQAISLSLAGPGGFLSSAANSETTSPTSPKILEWLFLVESTLYPLCSSLAFESLGLAKISGDEEANLESQLDRINTHLNMETFLVDDQLSVADVSVMCTLLLAFHCVPTLRQKVLSRLHNLSRWYMTVLNQNNVQKILSSTLYDQESNVVGMFHA